MLTGLIERFEHIANELIHAVRHGNEKEVHVIDAELQTLMQQIFETHARTRSEATAQIRFFNRLAVANCEDVSSVRRYANIMVSLFDRYLEPDADFVPADPARTRNAIPYGYDPSLHEMVLDSMPERVAVIGLDYRYIYCNKPNAEFHGKSPSEFIGRHLLDIVDQERFQNRVKPRLDQCFGGARVTYQYEAHDTAGRMFEVDCRMTPLAGPEKAIAGAVIVVSMKPLFARVA